MRTFFRCLPSLPAPSARGGHDDRTGDGDGCHGKEGLAADVAPGCDAGGHRHADLERHRKMSIRTRC